MMKKHTIMMGLISMLLFSHAQASDWSPIACPSIGEVKNVRMQFGVLNSANKIENDVYTSNGLWTIKTAGARTLEEARFVAVERIANLNARESGQSQVIRFFGAVLHKCFYYGPLGSAEASMFINY